MGEGVGGGRGPAGPHTTPVLVLASLAGAGHSHRGRVGDAQGPALPAFRSSS